MLYPPRAVCYFKNECLLHICVAKYRYIDFVDPQYQLHKHTNCSARRGDGPFFYGHHAAKLLQGVGTPGNGSDVPTGGAVWPTAIYWAMVEVGTPAQSYPVAIDSGSGDLDIGAKG